MEFLSPEDIVMEQADLVLDFLILSEKLKILYFFLKHGRFYFDNSNLQIRG